MVSIEINEEEGKFSEFVGSFEFEFEKEAGKDGGKPKASRVLLMY